LEDGPGVAFFYGIRVDPPYVFEGIDADTLTLNGLPFDPMRPEQTPVVQGALDPASLAEAQAHGQIAEDLLEQARLLAVEDEARSLWLTPDSAEQILALYRGNEHVESVSIDNCSVTVKFDFYSGLQGYYLLDIRGAETPFPERTRRVHRQEKIDLFLSLMDRGGLVLRGRDYSLSGGGDLKSEFLRFLEGGPEPAQFWLTDVQRAARDVRELAR
jgi:hypothetical protein